MSMQVEQTNMIKQQLRTGNVLSESVLALFEEVPRHEFVPSHLRHFAYSDMQLELPHHQRMMTPLEEAKLLQALQLTGNETVLEVGTGSGFLTALLSRLCRKVLSIEYFKEMTDSAREKLTRFQCDNVELVTGDGASGYFEQAPYDVVLFTGAIDALTETHRLQVLPGGKLFAIVGQYPIMQGQLHRLDHNNVWSVEIIFETCLPPLIDAAKPNVFVF